MHGLHNNAYDAVHALLHAHNVIMYIIIIVPVLFFSLTSSSPTILSVYPIIMYPHIFVQDIIECLIMSELAEIM
jgi:hypothetical protein